MPRSTSTKSGTRGQADLDSRWEIRRLDSAPLIYYIEQHPQYAPVTEDLFSAVDRGDSHAMTSVLTLLEVLVRPIRSGLIELAHEYRELLSSSRGVSLFPVGAETCELSARLRAKYEWIRAPDAIQVATALQNGAELIVTNDDRWRRRKFKCSS